MNITLAQLLKDSAYKRTQFKPAQISQPVRHGMLERP